MSGGIWYGHSIMSQLFDGFFSTCRCASRCLIHQFRVTSPNKEGPGGKEVAPAEREEKAGIAQVWRDALWCRTMPVAPGQQHQSACWAVPVCAVIVPADVWPHFSVCSLASAELCLVLLSLMKIPLGGLTLWDHMGPCDDFFERECCFPQPPRKSYYFHC